jgi:hypothetical protein
LGRSAKAYVREAEAPFWRAAALMGLVAFTSGCSGPREDVRVTLCKDMVSTQLATGTPPITWTETKTETRGYQYAAVRLRFSTSGQNGHAICYYDYDANDDTAVTLADPISAYSTSPSKMTLNGRTLSRSDLARAVKDAMLKQGRQFIDGARNLMR